MTLLDLSFRLGPSRTEPGDIAHRSAPGGTIIPRPSGIQHVWRQPAGRSTGGAFRLQDLERMQWNYGTGASQSYRALMQLYNPVLPWVWIYMLDPRDAAGVWVEAVMQEPMMARGIGTVMQSMTVQFHHVVRL